MSSKEPISEYDSNGKVIHCKNSNGFEWWQEFDTNGNMIHYKDSSGYEYWCEYDSNGKEIHYKDNKGYERWYWEGKITKDPIKILLLASQLCSKVPQ
jgi:YD repeat-containing protein